MENSQDKNSHYETRECVDCSSEFDITVGEQQFYSGNNMQLPRRCKACRDKRRAGQAVSEK